MQSTINLSVISLVAAILLMFAIALPAYANNETEITKYSELEIEIDQYSDGVIVEISYEDDGKEIEKKYSFEESELDEIFEQLADKLDLTTAEIEAASTVSEEDGSVNDEDVTATTTPKTDDDKGHGNDEDGCDEDNPGKKSNCVEKTENEDKNDSSEKPTPQEIVTDRLQDFGKTNDRTELQNQLHQLLVMLVELLQKKMLFQ